MGSLFQGVTQALTPQNSFQGQQPAVESQQQALAQALANQAAGQGPNPAQAQYQQNINQAIQQSAGTVASQKGISPALAQRLAAQQAAGMTQQAAGQQATLQAQQQAQAQQQQAGVLQNIGQEQLGVQAVNAGAAAQNASANQNTASGLLSGIGSAFAAFSKGGEVQGYAKGGGISGSQQIANNIMAQAGLPSYATGNAEASQQMGQAGAEIGGAIKQNQINNQFMNSAPGSAGEDAALEKMFSGMSKGGEVPHHLAHAASIYHPKMNLGGTTKVLLSPKERVIDPKDKMAVAGGKKSVFEAGKQVPGKPLVKGDNEKNDVVEANPKVGSVVIPKSIMESKDPVKGAANFVAEQLRKHGKDKGTPEEFKSALKKAIGSRKAA